MAITINKTLLRRLIGLLFIVAIALLLSPLVFKPNPNLPGQSTQMLSENDLKNEKTNRLVIPMTTKNDDGSSTIIVKPPTVEFKPKETKPALPPMTEEFPDPMVEGGNKSVVPESLWDKIESEPKTAVETPKTVTANKRPDPLPAGHSLAKKEPTNAQQGTNNAHNGNPATNTQKQAQAQTKPKTEVKPPAIKLRSVQETKPAAKTQTAQVSKPAQTAAVSSGGKGWYVQVGSFGSRQNANARHAEFKRQNLPAVIFVEGKFNKVQIGPYRTRDEAERIQSRLRANKIDTTILSR